MKKILFIVLGFFASLPLSAQNNDSTWFVNNYTKQEVMIPMRDGIKLFTSIYIPKDQAEQHPILMKRTPYSCYPYGEGKFMPVWHSYQMAYAKENYILVTQDVRGRFMSEGDFVDVRPFIPMKKRPNDIDESSDTYDAISWMIKNIANNNGKVGVFGISYPGFYSTMAAASNHPALKAVSPQAPVTDWFIGDDFHHNGAFFQMDGFNFYSVFGQPRPKPVEDFPKGFQQPIKDNYQFYLNAGTLKNLSAMIGDSIKFWHEVQQHPNYDNWWKERNARNAIHNLQPAMLWVGGLFDAEDLWGAWNCYKTTKIKSPNTNSKIVMGPWYHGQWASNNGNYLGNVRFASNTSAWYQQNIEVPFFNYYLKNKGTVNNIAGATIFFTGKNQWETFVSWPPKNVEEKELYIVSGNQLSFNKENKPSKFAPKGSREKSYTEYISDPAHPVPYTDGVLDDRTREYMTDDQRFASYRPDVLCFSTSALTEDLTLAGEVAANLFVSSSGTDADFVVKLIDVFPEDFQYADSIIGNNQNHIMGGYQMPVRAEIMRGKFRNSFEKPEPFIPNNVTAVNFSLPDVAHTFRKGHKIMIQIQSSWFPLVDRNPQRFLDIYKANADDFSKAEIRIYHSSSARTKFILPVLK